MPRRAEPDGAKSRTGSQEPSLVPSHMTSQILQIYNRRPMMRINQNSGSGASNKDGVSGDRDLQKSVKATSIWQERERSDAADAHGFCVHQDGKMNNVRRYLRAARTLYERQCRMKRPSAILKMKPNSYGLKSLSTFDALAVLVSPLRAHQMLDDWTGIEIGLFEEAYECFGKDFHAIAEHLPKKSVKDTVAFYYIWKKHGSDMKARDDGNLSDDILSEPEPDVTIQTLKFMGRLQKRQLYIQDYLDAARAIYSPQPSYASNQKRQKVSAFGLQRIACFQRGLKGVSPLRVPSILDTWTPFEIRLFEVAIECYGKDFPRIAEVTNKSCRDVVAFYYIWKNDSHYQVVKNRWERKNEADSTAKPPAD